MGASELGGVKLDDGKSPGVHRKQVRAANTGVCMEGGYPEGAILLNLGCGRIHWNGWVGVDESDKADIQADIRALPFPDNYADAAAAIHVIEHFYEWEAEPVLREWLRVLKPGGKLILELPCMDKVLDGIRNSLNNNLALSPTSSWFVFWGDPRYKTPAMVHKWGYTRDMLETVLRGCGFVGVEKKAPQYHFPARDMRFEAYKPSTT